jgi:hypothetical protein
MSYAQERRKEIPATGVEGMKSAGKSNGEEATLRKGSLPKAEAVRFVDRDANKGAATKAAQKQNSSDEKPYMHGGRNVIPNESNESLVCNCNECSK